MKPSTGFMTTSELVEAIKRRAFIPSAQNTLTDADIIRFLNEEMKDNMVPMLKATKEEYLVYSTLVNLEADKSRYDIPSRAIGSILRDIKFEDSYGNLFAMTQIAPEDRHYFQGAVENRFHTFYIENESVVLFPEVRGTPVGGIRMLFYMRPNDLVVEERAGQITNIDRTTGVITLDNLPEQFVIGDKIDLLKWKASHKLISYDLTITAINTPAKQVTVDPASIPVELANDDIVASAGECIIPQLPPELHSLLVEKVVSQCMKAQGDMDGYTLSQADLRKKEDNITTIIKNRSEGTPKKFSNFNSPLRIAKMNRRRFI